jgi:hypothetical protein
MHQVMYGSWDIPIQTSEALQAEIQAAGFIDAQVVQTYTPMGRLVVARRPASGCDDRSNDKVRYGEV